MHSYATLTVVPASGTQPWSEAAASLAVVHSCSTCTVTHALAPVDGGGVTGRYALVLGSDGCIALVLVGAHCVPDLCPLVLVVDAPLHGRGAQGPLRI